MKKFLLFVMLLLVQQSVFADTYESNFVSIYGDFSFENPKQGIEECVYEDYSSIMSTDLSLGLAGISMFCGMTEGKVQFGTGGEDEHNFISFNRKDGSSVSIELEKDVVNLNFKYDEEKAEIEFDKDVKGVIDITSEEYKENYHRNVYGFNFNSGRSLTITKNILLEGDLKIESAYSFSRISDNILNSDDFVNGTGNLSNLQEVNRLIDRASNSISTKQRHKFSDIDNSIFKPYIENLLDLNVLSLNSTFRPLDSITNSEFLKLAFNLNDIEVEKTSDWRKGYLDKGLTYGKSSEVITRGEAIKILMKVIGAEVERESSFSDVNGELVKYVEGALEKGIISKNDKFRPDDKISRGEMSKILVRAYEFRE